MFVEYSFVSKSGNLLREDQAYWSKKKHLGKAISKIRRVVKAFCFMQVHAT